MINIYKDLFIKLVQPDVIVPKISNYLDNDLHTEMIIKFMTLQVSLWSFTNFKIQLVLNKSKYNGSYNNI